MFVKTTHSLADRRTSIGFIRAIFCCQLTAGLQGSIVDGLKDLNVEQLGLWAFKWIAHKDKGVSQTLYPDSNRPVALVRPFSLYKSKEEACVNGNLVPLSCRVSSVTAVDGKPHLRYWVVVDVDDLIQVSHNNFGNRCKLFEVKRLLWGDIHVEGNGCQVTHCNLS